MQKQTMKYEKKEKMPITSTKVDFTPQPPTYLKSTRGANEWPIFSSPHGS